MGKRVFLLPNHFFHNFKKGMMFAMNVSFPNTNREILFLFVLLLVWLTWQKQKEFLKYGSTEEFTFHPGGKKFQLQSCGRAFLQKAPSGFCRLCFVPTSPASLYFICNPKDTPPKASQTIFHLSSHQVIINQLLLYLLLGIPCSSGSLHPHACHISLLLLGLPSRKFPFIIVQFSVL